MESIEQVAVGFVRDWRPSSLKSRASTRATSSREPCGCKKRVTTGRSLVISLPSAAFFAGEEGSFPRSLGISILSTCFFSFSRRKNRISLGLCEGRGW